MTDSNLKFNIFEDSNMDDLRVGYISPDTGYVAGITICEANDYAKLNPGTIFILKNRDQIRYLNINDVNNLTKEDLFTETGDACGGIDIIAQTPCKPHTPSTFEFLLLVAVLAPCYRKFIAVDPNLHFWM